MRRSVGLLGAALLAACGGSDSSGGGGAVCGDAAATGDEVCDGSDLSAEACATRGFTGGTLTCAADCLSFDTSGCTGGGAVCGDAAATGDEVCDGSDLGAEACTTQGFTGGTLTCAADCLSFDTSGCTGGGSTTVRCLFAGDVCIQLTGAMNAADISSLSADCGSVGAAFAVSACSTTGTVPGYCSVTGPAPVSGATLAAQTHYFTPAWNSASATSECGAPLEGTGAVCGDATLSGSEVCDGANLNGQTCVTQGFSGGTLACAGNCYGFDTRGCTGGGFNPALVTESEANGSIGTADGPYSTDHLISGAISPAGDLDYYAVRNGTASPITVRLETSIGGIGYCSSAYDTLIAVVDSSGWFVAEDDDTGVGYCSRLNLSIPAGTTYYVLVEELWGDPIPSYQLQVDFP